MITHRSRPAPIVPGPSSSSLRSEPQGAAQTALTVDRKGGISKAGNGMARHLLYEAANSLLARVRRPCALRDWGLALQARVGGKKARVAVARKLAMLMHRLWVRETDFSWPPATQTA